MLDPTITLFGKIIQVNGDVLLEVVDDCRRHNEVCVDDDFNSDVHREDEVYKELTEEQSMQNDEPNGICLGETVDESTNATEMSEITDLTDKASNDKDKQLLKKPDKILPCPRCNSMDTKFCYYNNYNVNQPRHFCRKCQRYWTAGGNMRNVPVGAGRRKNKASAPRYCHMTVSDTDVAVNNSGTVLSFGSDYPIPDSRAAENGDDRSSGSTVTTNSMEDQPKRQQFNGFNNQMQTPMQMQCFQLPYMWNPAFPVPIYPHPYWNGAPVPWNGPWAPTQIRPGPTPNPPTSLGKRTREGEIISQPPTTTTKTTKSSKVLIPKTLRIDDPDEAAKSSIWTTLGIKKDKGDPNVRKGFFNSLQSKGEGRNEGEIETSAALFKANPVALCRSFNFQEKT